MSKSRTKPVAIDNRRGRTFDWLSDRIASAENGDGASRARALTWLRDHGSPRMVMSLMLASTIGCGFITSVLLHRVGLGAPVVRYPLAVLAGWAVFLGLVSVWVWWQRRENTRFEAARSSARGQSSSGIDLPSGGTGGAGGGGSSWGGGGGRFGGAGASDSFADGTSDGFASGFAAGNGSSGGSGSGSSAASVSGTGGGGKGSGWDIDLGGDDGGFILLLIGIVVVAAAVFGVVFYAVYSAPTFFAELLIDGGVGTWIYRRADVANRPDWLSTAVRRSVWPVVVLLMLFFALAMVMRHVAPGATTLSQAWHLTGSKH
jgi:hypothetical protein